MKRTFTTLSGLLLIAGCGHGDGRQGTAAAPAPRDDGVVVLTEAQAANAGIETTLVAPGRIVETLDLVARVEPDEDAVVHVTPKVAGLVEAVHAGLGDVLEAGQSLAEIASADLGSHVASWLEARATRDAADETLQTAETLFEQRLQTLTEVLDAEVDLAQKVLQKEQELYEQQVATLRPKLEAEKALRQAELQRKREIVALQAERDRTLLDLRLDRRRAAIAVDAAYDQLMALQIDPEHLDPAADSPLRRGRFVVRAPKAGVVVARDATLGERVDTTTELFLVEDLAQVWVIASAYEKDLAKLRTGQPVEVRLDALPGLRFTGAVTRIGFLVSETTRSARVRIELPNEPVAEWPERFPLRPGMFGHASVTVAAREVPVAIPEAALVHEGSATYVFVAEGERTFRRVPVDVGGGGEIVAVERGLEAGQRVVVEGAFVLKSMARQDELGGED